MRIYARRAYEEGNALNNIELEFETVAPIFLHGSDPSGNPELRAPSLRGVMRYWFRAAAGAVIGDRNLTGLRSLEQAVFGQSEECASPISVRISQIKPNITNAYILPHNRQGRKQAISEGETFTVKLSAYRQLDPGAWESAISALLLATTFGGLGQRSRRGYGTVRIIKSSSADVPVSPTTGTDWQAHITNVTTQALHSATTLAHAHRIAPANGLRPTPASYPTATLLGKIRLENKTIPYPNSQAAVTDLMQIIHNFLAVPGRDTKSFLGYSPMHQGAPRQASPLWVRVVQTTAAPGFQLLFSVLASNFPNGHQDYAQLSSLITSYPGTEILIPGWNS